MLKEDSNKQPNNLLEIDIIELFSVIWHGKWIIASVTGFASVLGVIYSLSLPNIYESKAILVPANSSNSISGALQTYGGLAGLAGVNFPGNKSSNSSKAIAKINTLSFFKDNLLENIYLPDLLAVKSWNPETNILTYEESIYDAKTNSWVEGYLDPTQQVPSAQKSFSVFKSAHLGLIDDNKSGIVTLSIKHQSPFVAKQWAELVVNQINFFYRQKDKAESEKAVSYLNQQISTSNLSEIKEVLAQLLQEESKKLTLIEANEFYVFEYIDPPAAMEHKSEPKRFTICIISAFLGSILSVLLVLLRHYIFTNKKIH